MIRLTLTAIALAVSGAALAKLPAPTLDDAAKAKAAETAAKAAWQAKVDAFKLCQAQDRVAARVRKGGGANVPADAVKNASTQPTSAAAAKPAKGKNGAAATPATPATTTAAAPAAPVAADTPTPAPNVMNTPPVPPCLDPGPFAYAPPDQKPLETSGAHSPAATAINPPSVRPESAEMAPTKPGTAPSPAKKP